MGGLREVIAHLLIFWIHGESLDLRILKIALHILANNLQDNGIDLKEIDVLRWANFTNVNYSHSYS